MIPAAIHLFLEGAIERGLGFISNFSRCLSDADAASGQMLRGDLQAPIAQVLHWWRPDQRIEPFGERGARQPDLASQCIQRPAFRRLRVHQTQCTSDVVIAQARKPTRGFRRQPLQVVAYGLEKQYLAQFLGETIPRSISREMSRHRRSVARSRATRCGSGSAWKCPRSLRREHAAAEATHPELD